MYSNKHITSIITTLTLISQVPGCMADGDSGEPAADPAWADELAGSTGEPEDPGGSSGGFDSDSDSGGGSTGGSGAGSTTGGGSGSGGGFSPEDPTPGAIDAWTDGELGYALVPAGPDVAGAGIVEHLIMAPLSGEVKVTLYSLDADGEVVRAASLAHAPNLDGAEPEVSATLTWGGQNCTVPPCPWEEDASVTGTLTRFGDVLGLEVSAGGESFGSTHNLATDETQVWGALSGMAADEVQLMEAVLGDVAPVFPILSQVPDVQEVDWCKVGKYVASGTLSLGVTMCCFDTGLLVCIACGAAKDWAEDKLDELCKG